ncbi:hypothetical protein [Agromyces seonyuensis]|uniref:Uncharacterized protein n=1 Tax=Agromyces seonyuensis TaxID=2662446 RepID=A0A6I4P0Z1_9MICO|nr:hypothetical protein [Agromyces seonyuensis]MWB98395.1 hypothetical protein [Agromyces seonyuensis]
MRRSPASALLPAGLALVAGLLLAGCTAADSPAPASAEATASDAASAECAGVRVLVDFGGLDADPIDECVDADGTIAATDVLDEAGVTVEGSAEYGDQILCRVDGRPAADETVEVDGEEPFVESCASMPPAYAYWALWQRTEPDAEWGYAQEGVGTLQVEPGQSLGIVWTTGTETPTPED